MVNHEIVLLNYHLISASISYHVVGDVTSNSCVHDSWTLDGKNMTEHCELFLFNLHLQSFVS